MVHQPAAVEAVALAHSRPRLSLGLHIDIGEWRYCEDRWIPVYQRAPLDDLLALEASVAEQVELFHQLTRADPTHIDSHQHVHTREPLRSIVRQLAERLGVPLRHFSPLVLYCCDFYGQDEKGRPLAERLTASFLISVIRSLSDGITELCCHPAEDLDFRSTYHHERLLELDTLCSPSVLQVLEHEGVLLISFAEAALSKKLRLQTEE
jgi:predicted glycoside hydrolase/deacetylase ChbG (UPF0249 family)